MNIFKPIGKFITCASVLDVSLYLALLRLSFVNIYSKCFYFNLLFLLKHIVRVSADILNQLLQLCTTRTVGFDAFSPFRTEKITCQTD